MADTERRPLTISWSRLRTHEECKQKAWLMGTQKKNPAKNIRGFFHGTVVDRVMRSWLDSEDPQPGEMENMVADIINAEELKALETGDGVVRWKSKDDRKEMTAWCQDLVTRLEPILYDLVIPYDYEPAKRFRVPVKIPYLDGSPTWIFLVGEMDLLTRSPEFRFSLWDLKATKDDGYWRKTLGQLTFYDLCTAIMFDSGYCERIGLIQPMCRQPVIEFNFSEQDYTEMWVRIQRMAADMWQKEHPPKATSSGCGYCDVRHACERFKPSNTKTRAERLNLLEMQPLNLTPDVPEEEPNLV